MRCARGAKESADMPGQHASGREGSQECIRGTGPGYVVPARRLPSREQVQEQPVMLSCNDAASYVCRCGSTTKQHAGYVFA